MLNTSTTVRSLPLPTGRSIPILGQGTWGMGENARKRGDEIASLKLGLDLGLVLVDTAEMYGDGGAEEVVGDAIAGRRDDVYLVSKVYPHNATRGGTVQACDRSLSRLGTDYLDLYLLHWRGNVPLEETLGALQSLVDAGKILDYGVSNFDVDDMKEASALPRGKEIAVDQVLYNLKKRGIEWDLLPWCHAKPGPGVVVMAYSPIENSGRDQQRLLGDATVQRVAKRHDATPAQIAIAWLLHQGVVAIPKAASTEHVRENRAVLDLELSEEDLKELNQAFPAPHRKVSLAMR